MHFDLLEKNNVCEIKSYWNKLVKITRRTVFKNVSLFGKINK